MAKIRWISQKNNFSCGPIAILNLLKWIGLSISYKRNYEKLFKSCKCTWKGTHQHVFQKCLDKINGVVICPKNLPTIESIEAAIQLGQIVIMKSSYVMEKTVEGHFFIISEMTEDKFFCINIGDQSSLPLPKGKHMWVHKVLFAQYYLQYHRKFCSTCETSSLCGISPYAWFVKKQNQQ